MAKYLIGGGIVFLLVFGIWWQQTMADRNPDTVSRNGLHWHPQLEIYVKGEKVEIPESLGLGAVHNPVHTHDDLPVVHLEFGGIVRTEDITLGKFFEIWGRDLRSFGEHPHMTVNGTVNTEYDAFVMRAGDRIELGYD